MKKAITLVEILIAISILVSAIIPIWGLIGSSNQQVMKSYDEIKASQLTIEILEQIENYCFAELLPDDDDGKDYKLSSNGTITLNDDSAVIQVGSFEDYFNPTLNIFSNPLFDNQGKLMGCIVSLTMYYKTKEGQESKYCLRGFVSAK